MKRYFLHPLMYGLSGIGLVYLLFLWIPRQIEVVLVGDLADGARLLFGFGMGVFLITFLLSRLVLKDNGQLAYVVGSLVILAVDGIAIKEISTNIFFLVVVSTDLSRVRVSYFPLVFNKKRLAKDLLAINPALMTERSMQ